MNKLFDLILSMKDDVVFEITKEKNNQLINQVFSKCVDVCIYIYIHPAVYKHRRNHIYERFSGSG
jgi:hypothetical protein